MTDQLIAAEHSRLTVFARWRQRARSYNAPFLGPITFITANGRSIVSAVFVQTTLTLSPYVTLGRLIAHSQK